MVAAGNMGADSLEIHLFFLYVVIDKFSLPIDF